MIDVLESRHRNIKRLPMLIFDWPWRDMCLTLAGSHGGQVDAFLSKRVPITNDVHAIGVDFHSLQKPFLREPKWEGKTRPSVNCLKLIYMETKRKSQVPTPFVSRSEALAPLLAKAACQTQGRKPGANGGPETQCLSVYRKYMCQCLLLWLGACVCGFLGEEDGCIYAGWKWYSYEVRSSASIARIQDYSCTCYLTYTRSQMAGS